MNAYQWKQEAFGAAVDRGLYNLASQIDETNTADFSGGIPWYIIRAIADGQQRLTPIKSPPEQSGTTGHNQTLTPRRKCGIIKAIRRHVRRWKRKQEGKKMKWTNIWKVMYNPTGYGAVPYYFNSKEEAEKFANRDYADVPKRVAASESGDIPITVYKTAENADKDKGHTEYI